MEKRRFARLPVQVKVLEQSQAYNFSFGYGQNISYEGMSVESRILFPDKKKVKPGSKLQLRFKLPGGTLFLDLKGEVVWVKEEAANPSFGVRFLELSGDYQGDFDRFLRDRI